MSLDVTLRGPAGWTREGSGIFIREAGRMREITRAEWDERSPGQEPMVVQRAAGDDEVWSGNITHNLTQMANRADLYKLLWRPEELGITHAKQLIAPLAEGLCRLSVDPERYRALNPDNGWGSYEGLLEFVREYCVACIHNPEARVEVSR